MILILYKIKKYTNKYNQMNIISKKKINAFQKLVQVETLRISARNNSKMNKKQAKIIFT